jgi:Permeases of the major facilitator superfamily
VWEFWLNNAWNFQAAAWNSYYVIMLSEVVPQPKMYMFFSLLNCMGKTSSFVGPFISSAIIARAGGNTNMAYWFLFGTGLVGILLLACVSTDKAKVDVAQFLEREAEQLYSERQRTDAIKIVVHEAQTEVVA